MIGSDKRAACELTSNLALPSLFETKSNHKYSLKTIPISQIIPTNQPSEPPVQKVQ
jgi:hypothetical protein